MCGEANYRASLGALFTEAVLYGIYIPIFLATVYVHIYRKTVGRWFIAAAVAMFILSTALIITDFITYLLTPTLVSRQECSGNNCEFCSDVVASPFAEDLVIDLAGPIGNVLYTTLQLVADVLLTYRCYIIWQKKRWIIILPLLTLLASSILGYYMAYTDVQLYLIRLDASRDATEAPPKWWYYVDLQNKLNYPALCLSIASNVILTGSIASRIWWITREIERTLGRRAGVKYRSVIAMMIESGVAICIPMIVNIALIYHPLYEYIPVQALDQILGMTPTIIMLRVGRGIGAEQTFLSSDLSDVIPRSFSTQPIEFVPVQTSTSRDMETRESQMIKVVSGKRTTSTGQDY